MTINAAETHVTDPETEGTEQGRRTLWAWLGLARRRALWGVRPIAPPPAPRRRSAAKSPWWARAFVETGQPLAVVVVMAMCAPGEHHLAKLSGWNETLAWGMPVLLAGYAGMAAFLAGQRERGDRGYWTAVIGSWVALGLAMAAQPVSHAFVTGWLSAEPRTPLWLMVVVSCIPAPVLGHILHLAATRKGTAVPDASLLSTAEVADALGITESAVRSRVARGTLSPEVRDPELGNLFHPLKLQS